MSWFDADTEANRTLTNAERKDRSIRLWGESGQLALESAHVCLLNATPTGTEVLKNLVLPGIGHFTIVDGNKVCAADLGKNFFIDVDSINEPRCVAVTKLLLEMNDEVSGHWVEQDPCSVIESKPSFFQGFTCVIACDIVEDMLLKLSNLLWGNNIPLFVAKSYGLIGYWRSVVPQITIVEAHPEFPLEDMRLVHPFPELEAFCNALDPFADLGKKHQSRIPAFVLLHHALKLFRIHHNGQAPKTNDEKKEFKKIIESFGMHGEQENVVQAIEMAAKTVFAFATPQIPPHLSALFADKECEEISPTSSAFWILVRALREFVSKEGEGFLPLSGTIPDMHCDTQTYVTLEKIYHDKAKADAAAVCAHIKAIQAAANHSKQIRPDRVRLFCKNAANIQVVRMRSLEQEYTSPISVEWSFYLDLPEMSSHHYYLLIRTIERFRSLFQRYPSNDESDVSKMKEICVQVCSEVGLPASVIKDDSILEMCWHGGNELHSVAAVIGGVGAQEVQKIIMQQFVPLNNTFIYNGVSCINTIAIF